MARPGAKKKSAASPKSESTRPPADPRLFRVDSLQWGGAKAAKLGRKDALLGRVERLEISLDGSRIQARVRGERAQPYRVQIWVDRDAVSSRCECSEGAEGPCRHAVAGLEALRFPLRKQLEGKARKAPARVKKGGGRIVRSADADESFRVLGEQPRDLTRRNGLLTLGLTNSRRAPSARGVARGEYVR